jgi:hypothetical protein
MWERRDNHDLCERSERGLCAGVEGFSSVYV